MGSSEAFPPEKVNRIKISGRAYQDPAEGADFYDRQSLGVGDYFLDCLEADIEGLKITGGIHRQLHGDYYRLLSRVFPYAVFYKFHEAIVEVRAVVDCRRNPSWIRKRLSE